MVYYGNNNNQLCTEIKIHSNTGCYNKIIITGFNLGVVYQFKRRLFFMCNDNFYVKNKISRLY